MELNEIQQYLDKVMNDQNNQAITDFEGYSPHEMQQILYFTLEPQSPISLNKLENTEYEMSPMFNQIKYFLELILKTGEIKLTAKGYLPPKIVKDIYNRGFIKEYNFESGLSKQFREADSLTINLTKHLADLSGLTKKRNGKLSLTKTGKKIYNNNHELFVLIFKTMTAKFRWAYYDGYENEEIGQLGYGFSLILLAKYGKEKRLDSFYAEKYFKAFPQLLKSLKPAYDTLEKYAANCYSIRTFERFLDYFGLIILEQNITAHGNKVEIIKTELFDKLIKVRPHNVV